MLGVGGERKEREGEEITEYGGVKKKKEGKKEKWKKGFGEENENGVYERENEMDGQGKRRREGASSFGRKKVRYEGEDQGDGIAMGLIRFLQ